MTVGYDEDTVRLVAEKAFVWHNNDDLENIRSILGALADAGLLLPPGGEMAEEWGVLWANVGHRGGTEHEASGDEATVRAWAVNMRAEMAGYTRRAALNIDWVKVRRRVRIVWPDGSMYTGPWSEVSDDPA